MNLSHSITGEARLRVEPSAVCRVDSGIYSEKIFDHLPLGVPELSVPKVRVAA